MTACIEYRKKFCLPSVGFPSNMVRDVMLNSPDFHPQDLKVGASEYVFLSTYDCALSTIIRKQGTLSTACESVRGTGFVSSMHY